MVKSVLLRHFSRDQLAATEVKAKAAELWLKEKGGKLCGLLALENCMTLLPGFVGSY